MNTQLCFDVYDSASSCSPPRSATHVLIKCISDVTYIDLSQHQHSFRVRLCKPVQCAFHQDED